MEPVPLRKLLSSSETAALLEDLAKITSEAVCFWVVYTGGEGIEKEFSPIIEEVHQVAKTIRFPQGVALPIVVEGRLLGVLMGERVGPELSEPSAAFEHLGRMRLCWRPKRWKKGPLSRIRWRGTGEINLLYTLLQEMKHGKL